MLKSRGNLVLLITGGLLFLFCGVSLFIYYDLGIGFDFFQNLLFSFLLFCILITLIRFSSNVVLYSFISLLAIGYVIITPYYSPIDEGAHFDYILHIINEGKLPTLFDQINVQRLMELNGAGALSGNTPQYEAVHPPLYYIISALIILPFKGHIELSFVILRLFGVVLILGSLFFVIKAYAEMVKKKLIQENKILFYSIVIALFVSPGFMTRMITLSNEQLVVFLTTLLFYMIIKINIQTMTRTHLILLSILSAATVLTKFTSIFILGVIFIYFVIYRKWRHALFYLIIFFIIMSPWLIYNYVLYGAFTGTSLHVQFVLSIVNPDHLHLGFVYIFESISRFLSTFWNPQEVSSILIDPFYFFMTLLNTILVGSIIIGVWKNINFRILLKKDSVNGINALVAIFTLSIVLNVLVLAYGTYTQSVDVMLGRYFYINILPLSILLFYFITKVIDVRYQIKVGSVVLFLSCCLAANTISILFQNQGNMINKFINNHLEQELTFDNFQDEKYSKILNVQDMGALPSRIGKSAIRSEWEDAAKLPVSQFNSIEYDKNRKSIKIIGNDPFIVFDTDTRTLQKKYNSLLFTLHGENLSNMRIQLFWDNGGGFSESNSIWLDASDKGTYVLPISGSDDFIHDENISRIRIDFENYNAEMFELDGIYVK